MKLILLVLAISFPFQAWTMNTCPREFSDQLVSTRKLILMTGDGFNELTGSLQLFARETTQDAFIEDVSAIADRRAVFGSNGLAWGQGFTALRTGNQPIKREGDRRSPIGVYKIGVRFGFATTGGKQFLPLVPTTECVDDTKSRYYSQIIDTSNVNKDWSSAEKMRAEPLYERGIDILYNPGQIDSAGSCIFLHHWREPTKGTAGCGAMNPKSMQSLHLWLGDETDAAVLIIPRSEIERIRACLKLAPHRAHNR